jgi:hypothetical protein
MPTEEDISRKRPVAIMLNNDRADQPMNGVSRADIVYEVPVEGVATRMMAVFQDYQNIILTGPVRSARHYFVYIAGSYDGIIMSSGASEPAYDASSAREIPLLTADRRGSSLFVRNRNRVSGRTFEAMRSMVTNERLMQRLPDVVTRLTHEDNFTHALTFSDNATPVGGSSANSVEVRFSSHGKISTFTYDADRNVYSMRQHGSNFIDANNGTHVSFSNLIVIRTPITALQGPHGVAGRRDMPTTGTGVGYFVHGGQIIEINWSRPNYSSQFSYTLKDGTELVLGRGKTYIGIITTDENNARVTFE